jgi:3-hydroxybutyryl-CoA dehydrogenase
MTDLEFGRVAVLGAGTMGAGIAQICAAAGSRVALFDVEQRLVDAGLARVREFLDKGVEKGKTKPEERDTVRANLRGVAELRAAVADADLVIEAIPEKLDLKRQVFGDVARACGAAAVLASNTSSLALGDIFAGIPQPARCLGMHFFNPPPLMPLLEVVKTAATGDAVVQRVLTYAKRLGKDPIVVKDSPGFASSRLGVVLGLEAIRMLEAGVASAADIDKAMELGYRHPMGPLKLTDLVGLDVRLAIADYLRDKLDSPAFTAPALMRTMVAEGKLGKKSGQGFYTW